MVSLKLKHVNDPRYPDFWVPRLVVDLYFEPVAGIPDGTTVFDSALLDSGAGYLTIPHRVHKSQHLKVFRELGHQPYRIASARNEPLSLQRFVEIGIRCLGQNSDGTRFYWPEQFVKAQAYFLDADQKPQTKVLVGLDVLLEHFITHLEKDNSFLQRRL